MERKEIGKWGNSLSFRIPNRMATSLDWNSGDEVDVELFRNSLLIRKVDSDTTEDILKTIAASIDYIMYNREYDDFDMEVERQLLKTISLGAEILLDEEETAEDHILRMAQIAINFVLDRYGPREE